MTDRCEQAKVREMAFVKEAKLRNLYSKRSENNRTETATLRVSGENCYRWRVHLQESSPLVVRLPSHQAIINILPNDQK